MQILCQQISFKIDWFYAISTVFIDCGVFLYNHTDNEMYQVSNGLRESLDKQGVSCDKFLYQT